VLFGRVNFIALLKVDDLSSPILVDYDVIVCLRAKRYKKGGSPSKRDEYFAPRIGRGQRQIS